MKHTTIKLRLSLADWLRVHEMRVRDTVSIACIVAILLIVRGVLTPQPTAEPAMVQQPRPIILIQTSTAMPSPTPAPTATPIVEVRYLEAPTPEPIYVEVPIYVASEPVQEAPAAPQEAPAPTLAPAQMVILDRGAWAVQAATARAGR